MTYRTALRDYGGREFIVLVHVDEQIIRDKAVPRLATKARSSKTRKAKALDGAITVTIEGEVPR